MKDLAVSFFSWLIAPFYGSGIGKYRPFSVVASIYDFMIRDSVVCSTIYGFKIKTHPQDTVIRKSLKINGFWEKNISELIIKHVQEGYICLDIGANIGYDTLLLSQQVGPKGSVFCVEPVQKNIVLINENIRLNNIQNVEILKFAASNENKTQTIYFSDTNPGGSSLYNNDRKWDSAEEIDLKVLDTELSLDRLDFVKLDVEGHELCALLGMEQTILRHHPLMIFEWSPILYNDKKIALNILSFFLRRDYSLYHIDNKGVLSIIKDIEEYYNNIMALPFSQSDIYAKYGE